MLAILMDDFGFPQNLAEERLQMLSTRVDLLNGFDDDLGPICKEGK